MPVETTPKSYLVETTPESEGVGTLDNVNESAPAFEGSPPVACLPFNSMSENVPRYRTRASIQRVPTFVRPPYDYGAARFALTTRNFNITRRRMAKYRARQVSLSNPSYYSYCRWGGKLGFTPWFRAREHHLSRVRQQNRRLARLAAGRTHSMSLRTSTDMQRQHWHAATNTALTTRLA
jgi:hypothetical protein